MSIQKQNRANGKIVLSAEFISSTQVVVTYSDFSKNTFTAADYKSMHRDIHSK